MEEKRKEKRHWHSVRNILKVLYSPTKAFEEVVKNPTVKGPILILLLALPITLAVQYTSGTKFFLETPTPESDLWTERPSDSAPFLWTSNHNVTFDDEDHISGNYSVSTHANNSSHVWMRLTNIGSLNCSEGEFDRLSFRIKWVNEKTVPSNAILQVSSFGNESNRFELDIEPLLANQSEVWTNITANLANDDWKQMPANVPSWSNVTGMGFQLNWADFSNITLRIDAIYFGKYDSLNSLNTITVRLVNSMISGTADFILRWFLLTGFLYLILKTFLGWKGSWKNELYVFGHVYSPSLVHNLVYLLFLSLLPPLFIPYTVLQPLSGEEANARELLFNIYESRWGNQPTYILVLPWLFAFYVWTAILCTIALRRMHELSWMKALLMAGSAFALSELFRLFIPL